MKLKSLKRVYWKQDWNDPQAPWFVGELMVTNSDIIGTRLYVSQHGVLPASRFDDATYVLVRHSHSQELEFVEWSKLFNYYGDKTPPEFEKEHASVPYKSDEELKEIANKQSPIAMSW